MKKSIAYLRVSTTKQVDEGSSLDNQEAKIRAYCTLNDIELLEIIVDAGLSGKKDNREGFLKVLSAVKSRSVDSIVVYSLSRFTRSTKTLLEVTELMAKNSVELHSINEKLDTSTALGKFFYTLLGAINELESNQTGERIKDVKRHNKSEMKTYCTPVYGFSNDLENKKLVPVQEELDVVGNVKKWYYEDGVSMQSIAEMLNDFHVPTKKNGKWYSSTVKNILDNKIYG